MAAYFRVPREVDAGQILSWIAKGSKTGTSRKSM